MKLGLRKEGKTGPKFVYVENLNTSDYHDITSLHSLVKVCRKVGLHGKSLKQVLSEVVDNQGGYANLSFKQQELVINYDVPVDRTKGDGKLLFIEDKEYTIYQEGPIDINFNDTNFEKSGVKVTLRVHCNGAPMLIGGNPISEVNKLFTLGETKFVILHNDTVLRPGFINYFEFEYINHDGIEEIRVEGKCVKETASGGSSDGISDWKPYTFYKLESDVIGLNQRLYNCIEEHTSSDSFEADLELGRWERQGSVDEGDILDFEEGLSDLNFDPVDFTGGGENSEESTEGGN